MNASNAISAATIDAATVIATVAARFGVYSGQDVNIFEVPYMRGTAEGVRASFLENLKIGAACARRTSVFGVLN